MPKVRIAGRYTRLGAETTAYPLTKRGHVEVIESSKSETHWLEEITGDPGFEFIVIDITNSGKHRCFRGKIGYDDSYEIIARNEDTANCEICGGRFRKLPEEITPSETSKCLGYDVEE